MSINQHDSYQQEDEKWKYFPKSCACVHIVTQICLSPPNRQPKNEDHLQK